MFVIHYFEKNTSILSQWGERIPAVNENIKIKGHKGQVVDVVQIEDNKYHVHVTLEKIKNKEILLNNDKKKRR